MSLVAIVMRTYERPVLLARAIASVQSQTFSDWHLIVVNNGGDPKVVDDVVAVASQANPAHDITVVHLAERVGMEEASNQGLAASNAEFFVIHDDDDSWKSEFLERSVATLQKNPAAAAVVTGVTRIHETFRGSKVWPVRHEDFYLDEGRLTLRGMIGNNTFPPIAALFRSRVLAEVGNFDASLPVLGDWEFNLRAVRAGGFVFINERLAHYHTRTSDSDVASGNSITVGQDLHRNVKLQLQNRWLTEPAVDGVNKGMLSLAAEAVFEIDELRRNAGAGTSGDVEAIAHRTAEIMALRSPMRRVARVVRRPSHALRVVKRMLRRSNGQ